MGANHPLIAALIKIPRKDATSANRKRRRGSQKQAPARSCNREPRRRECGKEEAGRYPTAKRPKTGDFSKPYVCSVEFLLLLDEKKSKETA